MMEQIFSWATLLTVVGLIGFYFAGKKKWWCWYINIGCQVLWFTYAIVTEQYAFIAASLAYTWVFTKNAISWTREHRELQAAIARHNDPKFDVQLSMQMRSFTDGMTKALAGLNQIKLPPLAQGPSLKEFARNQGLIVLPEDQSFYPKRARKGLLESPIVDIVVEPTDSVFPESVVYLLTDEEQEILADLCTPIHDYLRGLE